LQQCLAEKGEVQSNDYNGTDILAEVRGLGSFDPARPTRSQRVTRSRASKYDEKNWGNAVQERQGQLLRFVVPFFQTFPLDMYLVHASAKDPRYYSTAPYRCIAIAHMYLARHIAGAPERHIGRAFSAISPNEEK
jgi:hypothetical protein